MRAIRVTVGGRVLYLAYNCEAMFTLEEMAGDTAELFGKMQPNNRAGVAVLTQAAAILAEQGELIRRSLGYDKAPIITPEQLAAIATPRELLELKNAIPKAIHYGLALEIGPEEGEEIDLGLLELQQKKTR